MSSDPEAAITRSQAACAFYGVEITPRNETICEAKIDAIEEVGLYHVNNSPTKPFLVSNGRIRFFPFRYSRYRRTETASSSTFTMEEDKQAIDLQVIR
jgi:hypothetical protein